ncbi:hypothetical protein Hanom_Chr08g00693331 [Helianthus anomalus]
MQIQLYKNALQVLEHSKSMNLDDLEKTHIGLAELFHVVGGIKCLSIFQVIIY